MDVKMTNKVLSNYERGWNTPREVANKLLYELVMEPKLDEQFVLSVNSLPDKIKQALLQLLRSIKENDYEWTPLLLGVRTGPPNPREYSEKLRQIDALLASEL
jgi:hypothetical protein